MINFCASFRALLISGLLGIAASLPSAAVGDTGGKNPALSEMLAPILSGTWRSEANRARDKYRHPADTLAFFGVRPDSKLIEITPGGGWYAEILAPLLKAQGHYTALIINPESASSSNGKAYLERARTSLTSRMTSDATQFSAMHVVETDLKEPVFGPPASADIVLSFRNLHNWVDAGTERAYLKAAFAVLKPGGTFGIVDHRAMPDKPMVKGTGYLPTPYVIQLATEAGFRLDAQSEVNANPKDTRDHPKGVWTLPPTLAMGEVDKDKYLAIGESDRFTLRFVK